jgi:hypothetical protein
MAERIDFSKIDRNDPRFLEIDPNNPNTNISASRFDPTDPTADVKNPASASARYNQFLQTANIGDTFDFGGGVQTKFTGFNQMGTPIIQTIESPERQNWRGAIAGAGPSYDAQMKALMDTGRSEQEARFLIAQTSGPEFVAANMGSAKTQLSAIGAMADGTPIYGYGSDGKPVTSPTGTIYSTASASDAVSKFASGSAPLSTRSSATGLGATGTAGDAQRGERQSAYDLLLQQFNQYGLGALVEPLRGLIISGASPAEFTIKLRESDAYKKRFAANQSRIQKGLTAISEAEYLGLEDQYQNIMRNYGLPAEYYARGDMGTQEGFNRFIANDVSAAELEDRIMTAQSRVMNANPEVLASLKQFYPGITNGDILAYTLDPTKGLTDIKRKVTAAEIGGAATQAGLGLTGTRAEELGAAGITKQQAQQGFQTVAEVAPRGGQLAEIYKQNPYTQTTAEAEVFGLSGSAEAARQRKKLTSLETAAFSGSAGAGAIARDRAGVL